MGRHPAVYLMGRGAIPSRLGFARPAMRPAGVIRYYPRFPEAIPEEGAGSPRVTQPFATRFPPEGGVPFDLHVLGAPPAFILSQDRTLRPIMMAGRCVRSRSWWARSARPDQHLAESDSIRCVSVSVNWLRKS